MKIKKEVKQEENIYMIYNLLILLQEYYRNSLPPKINKMLLQFINKLRKEYWKNYEKLDVIDYELIEKVTFEDIRNWIITKAPIFFVLNYLFCPYPTIFMQVN